jgi:hypothetical protein
MALALLALAALSYGYAYFSRDISEGGVIGRLQLTVLSFLLLVWASIYIH